jgi:hypothetical protein
MVVLAVIILGCGFYWYQIRPVMISRSCSDQASFDARKLLLSKVELTSDRETKASYKALAEKNMYLRTDYNAFMLKCMLHYGFQIVPVSDDTRTEEAEAPAPEPASVPSKSGTRK